MEWRRGRRLIGDCISEEKRSMIIYFLIHGTAEKFCIRDYKNGI